jgi:anaerobic ribonucleoside-triphosphate reductase activating protein
MKISINKMHFPVTTLGYGRRIGIWMQGCPIHCEGCINKDTWDRDIRHDVELQDVLQQCQPWLNQADGLTVSGGEPFAQPEALSALLERVRSQFRGDVLVYSGFEEEFLFRRYTGILRKVDVLVSGPYLMGVGDSLVLRGSDNQRIKLLTDLARYRYPAGIDTAQWGERRRFDVIVGQDDVWLAGIPRAGEIARLKAKLDALGFNCTTSQDKEGEA